MVKRKIIFKLPEDIVMENQIYLYENGHLKVKKINVLKQEGKFLIVKGITENDDVIVSPVVDVVNGMQVKLGDK